MNTTPTNNPNARSGGPGDATGSGKFMPRLWAGGIAVLLVVLLVGVILAIRGALTPIESIASGPQGGTRKLDSIDAVLNASKAYVRENELGKAEAVLLEGIRQWPDEASVYVSYGELLVSMKKPREAYEQYEKALACGKRDPEVEFTAGTVANMAGQPERALEHYSAAQAAKPGDKRIPLYMAQVQLKLDQITEAKANLLIAGRLDPENPMVWGTLAEAALRENKLDLALSHVAKAREAEPENLSWRLIEGRALARQLKPEEALQRFVGLSDSDRRDPTVLQLMSECYGLLRRPGDAAALYVKAADADAGNGDLAMQAALWLQRAGDPERAKVYAKRAKMLDVQGAATVLELLEKK